MLKGVIFDMDGVLVDSEPFHQEAENIVFSELGIEVPESMRKTFVGKSGRLMWQEIRDSFGIARPVDELLGLDRNTRIRHFSALERINTMPGVIDLLADLAENGMKLAVASSSSIEIIGIILEKTRLCTFFKTVVSGDSVKHGKPHPDIFIRTAKLLRLKRTECIVIEDSSNGAAAAKGAKMYCIGYRNRNSGGQDLSMADFVTEDFGKLTFELMKQLALKHNLR